MGGEIGADIDGTLRSIGSEIAAEFGLELVELTVGRAKKRWHLRFDIDRPGSQGVGLADCERLSRTLGQRLEDDDLIPGSYVLEVSSPGIDRPIRTADDVRRNAGRRVVVETAEPVDGQRTFRGLLVDTDGATLRLRDDGGDEVRIPLDGIVKARQEAAF